VFCEKPPKNEFAKFHCGISKEEEKKGKKKIRHMEKRIDNAEFEVGPWE